MNEPVNCTNAELETYINNLRSGFLSCQNLEHCISSPGPEEGCSPTLCSDTSAYAQSRSIPIASKSYRRGKKTVVFRGFQSLRMSRSSTERHGADWLMSSQEGSLAPIFPQPAKEPESTERTADYGVKWQGSLAKYDRTACLWKTAQCSLLADSEEFSETWPRWGSMRNGALYLRPIAVLRTSVNASGSWPTQAANEYEAAPNITISRREKMKSEKKNGNGFGLTVGQAAQMWATPCTPNGGRVNKPADVVQVSLESQANAWQTPKSADADKRGDFDASNPRNGLVGQAKSWGTPTARDHKDSGDCSNVPENGLLGRMAKSWSGMTNQPGSLNPEFHLWLMAWPFGWTGLEPLEMGKFQLWLQQHSTFCQEWPVKPDATQEQLNLTENL